MFCSSKLPVPDCHKKHRFPYQKERISAIHSFPATGRKAANKARSVKKRAGELSVWSISPPRRAFSCGKNGISFSKEICVLPQRRKFLAAKKFSGVWKAGKNGASDSFFLLIGSRPRTKSGCHSANLSLCRADPPAKPDRTTFRPGRQSVAEAGFPPSSCISASPRGSRISVRTRPCVLPRDSRGAGSGVLTK